ncbi:MAG: hypothetical protein LH630_04315 [Actinomycetia bacterium]|nr:hypothetical protein [Actinomycetes bacterium]
MGWARRNSWWVYVLLCSALVSLFYSIPLIASWPWVPADSQSLIWTAMAVIAVAAMTLGMVIQRPPTKAAWILFTTGVALTGFADTWWEFPQLIGLPSRDMAYPSILDYL